MVGWVVVWRVGWVWERRVVKRETWARARAEERVPIRRVGGVLGSEGGGFAEGAWDCEGGGLEVASVGGGCADIFGGRWV